MSSMKLNFSEIELQGHVNESKKDMVEKNFKVN